MDELPNVCYITLLGSTPLLKGVDPSNLKWVEFDELALKKDPSFTVGFQMSPAL